jgi:hypothetical protein
MHTRLADTCTRATVKLAAYLIQYICGLACVAASCKATAAAAAAAAAMPVLGSSVLYASNTRHAAAVIWLRLVNACLSRIADDKLDGVIHYCFVNVQDVVQEWFKKHLHAV